MPADARKSLGQFLIDRGVLTREQLQAALSEARKQGIFLRQALLRLKLVGEESLLEYFESEIGIPRVDLSAYECDPELRRLVPEKVARKHNLVPLFKIGTTLTVAMVDPLDIMAQDEVKVSSDCEVEAVAALESQVSAAIESYYPIGTALETFAPAPEPTEVESAGIGTRPEGAEEGPAVKMVNAVLAQAARDGASDIHIEPEESVVRVRLRVDGMLLEHPGPPKHLHSTLVSRIKVLCDLDISERRVPQDGRFRLNVDGKELDLRVSTCPTIHGENVVIRLLRKDALVLGLDSLGLSARDLGLVNQMITRPHGMMLVTGPTGSGKTTTLYSCLSAINNPSKNIMTLEDPVEYRLPYVRQAQIDAESGLTFARGLRSFLRQDPDIVMLGEVRDAETAEIATRAALTGHLVLSTLHTNDAPSALARLLDMGIDPFLVSSSVIGVVAQRLVRGVCEKCRTADRPSPKLRERLGVRDPGVEFQRGAGCKACNQSGHKGRIPIFEVLVMDDELRSLIAQKAPFESMAASARRRGMTTLRDDALEKAARGLTSLEEVARVAGEDFAQEQADAA